MLGRPVPRRAGEVLPQVGAMVEGPAAYPHLSGRTNLALFDAAGPGGGRRDPRGAGSTRRWTGSAWAASTGGRSRRTRSACGSGSAWPRALLREPRLLILDEPTNGLDPRGIREIRDLLTELNAAGTTVFLSSHLLAEVEQFCTRVGVMDRGRLVLQDDLDALRAPTGRVVRGHAGPGPGASRCSTAGSSPATGDRLVVRHADPAELNARLVADGIRVAEIGAASGGRWRRSCWRRPRPAPTGWTARVIARRAGEAVPPAADVRHHRRCCALLPFIVAIFLATTRIPPPPGQGGAFLSAVLSNGALYPAAAMALVLPVFLPVAVAVLAGDSVAGEAATGTLRYLLIRPVGRTRLLVAKLVALVAFVLFAIAMVVLTSYLTGSSARHRPGDDRRRGAAAARRDVAVRRRHHAGRARAAAARRRSPTSRCRCSASRRSRCSCPRSPTPRWAPRWARSPRWSPARCW